MLTETPNTNFKSGPKNGGRSYLNNRLFTLCQVDRGKFEIDLRFDLFPILLDLWLRLNKQLDKFCLGRYPLIA